MVLIKVLIACHCCPSSLVVFTQEMGYPRGLARDALRAARGSVSAAVAWLLENTC